MQYNAMQATLSYYTILKDESKQASKEQTKFNALCNVIGLNPSFANLSPMQWERACILIRHYYTYTYT